MADLAFESQTITLDELLKLSDKVRVEVFDYQIVEMPIIGILHHLIAGNIFRILYQYNDEYEKGIIFSHGLMFLMNSNPNRISTAFIPDGSFIHRKNLHKIWDIHLPFPGTPDLAIEVITPNEGAGDIQRKARTYLEKGTQLVWIVYPDTKEVHQYQANQTPEIIRVFHRGDTIEIPHLFPDLKITTTDIFQIPTWL